MMKSFLKKKGSLVCLFLWETFVCCVGEGLVYFLPFFCLGVDKKKGRIRGNCVQKKMGEKTLRGGLMMGWVRKGI